MDTITELEERIRELDSYWEINTKVDDYIGRFPEKYAMKDDVFLANYFTYITENISFHATNLKEVKEKNNMISKMYLLKLEKIGHLDLSINSKWAYLWLIKLNNYIDVYNLLNYDDWERYPLEPVGLMIGLIGKIDDEKLKYYINNYIKQTDILIARSFEIRCSQVKDTEVAYQGNLLRLIDCKNVIIETIAGFIGIEQIQDCYDIGVGLIDGVNPYVNLFDDLCSFINYVLVDVEADYLWRLESAIESFFMITLKGGMGVDLEGTVCFDTKMRSAIKELTESIVKIVEDKISIAN